MTLSCSIPSQWQPVCQGLQGKPSTACTQFQMHRWSWTEKVYGATIYLFIAKDSDPVADVSRSLKHSSGLCMVISLVSITLTMTS